jgi:hypothetical protein
MKLLISTVYPLTQRIAVFCSISVPPSKDKMWGAARLSLQYSINYLISLIGGFIQKTPADNSFEV